MTFAPFTGCGKKEGEYTVAGYGRIAQSDYPGAIGAFIRLSKNRENEELAYRGKGLAYLGMADYENALSCI